MSDPASDGEEPALPKVETSAPFEQSVRDARLPPASGLERRLGLGALLQQIRAHEGGAGPDSAPQQLGRLQVEARIGEDATGVVYRAYDPELDRQVAVKVLRSGAGEVERDRIAREARALARLGDPRVVTVYDAVTTGDDLYLTMELVEGISMRQWLDGHPRATQDEVLGLFLQAGHGLAAAHRARLVHRDFRSENVLVGADGRVKVVDFALAEQPEGADAQRATQASAPALEDSLDGVAGLDLRAMSLTLPPLPVFDAARDLRSFCRSALSALEGRPGARPGVEQILKRGILEEAGERWGSMAELLAALEAVLDLRKEDNLRLLASRVEQLWVHGVLDAGLGGHRASVLKLESAPEHVQRPWLSEIPEGDRETRRLRFLLERSGTGLLLLGAPGGGKTTALLGVARELLETMRGDATAPVPVVLNLSSFRPAEGQADALLNWVVSEIVSKYSLPRLSVASWLAEDRLILLLDGLDEIPIDNLVAAINAINSFLADHAPLTVVSSREEEYRAAGAKLDLGAALRIEPPDDVALEQLLRHRDPRLVTRMREDPALRDELRNPLLTALLGDGDAVPDSRSAGDWANTYRRYVRDAFADDPQLIPRYSATLHFLAKTMRGHDMSDLWLERMRPSWLPTRTSRALARGLGIALVVLCHSTISFASALLFERAFPVVMLLVLGPLPVVAIQSKGYRFELREDLTWSWRRGLLWVPLDIALGAAVGAVMGYFQKQWVYIALCGFAGAMLAGVTGFEPSDRALRVRPNAGIVHSLRTAVVLTLLSAVPIGLAYGYGLWPLVADVAGSDVAHWADPRLPVFGSVAVFCAVCVFFAYGGAVVFLHYALRLVLALRTPLPFFLVPFLDDCVSRGLLRRVGGGYIFLHRTLQDYFAGLDVAAPGRD